MSTEETGAAEDKARREPQTPPAAARSRSGPKPYTSEEETYLAPATAKPVDPAQRQDGRTTAAGTDVTERSSGGD